MVKETSRINGGVSTMVGANEGMLQMGIRLPNVLGRGEKVTLEHMISSSKERRSEIFFTKPFPDLKGQ